MSERSIPPSENDLARARRGGDLPLSPLLVFGSALLALRVIAPRSFDLVRSSFEHGWSLAMRDTPLATALREAMTGTVRAVVLPLGALAVAVTVASLVQTGAAWRDGRAADKGHSTGIPGIGALIALAVTLAAVVRHRPDAVGDVRDAATRARAATDALIGALFATGVVDFAIRRWQWTKSLHRSVSDARRSARDDEGDPYLRAARRVAHRMLLEETVPTRDWHVITDGRGSVVIAWREGMDAPRVVLHAQGALHAELAVQSDAMGLPTFYRPDLVRRLLDVPVGEVVPAGTWETVARLITEADGSRRR